MIVSNTADGFVIITDKVTIYIVCIIITGTACTIFKIAKLTVFNSGCKPVKYFKKFVTIGIVSI